MDLNDTAAFVAVARAGSFTQAATRLGLPKGTVSRQIARLERHLGARLLQRTTRQVSLTDVGRAYYERCRHAVEAIVDAERLVADVQGTVTGTIRVATSFDFGRDWLGPWLPDLRKQHPELRIELELSQRRIDLVADNIDVAIRGGGQMDDSGQVARKLADSRLLFCASPSYLKEHGTPKKLDDLANHECLTLHRPNAATRWRFQGPNKEPVDVDLKGWLAVNELGVLRDTVIQGLGIGFCEENSIAKALHDHRLRHILPDYALTGAGLWAVYPSTHHLSPKVRAFVDFVAEKTKSYFAVETTKSPRK
jgi:DNA-binding transcriptional LysR family regulator